MMELMLAEFSSEQKEPKMQLYPIPNKFKLKFSVSFGFGVKKG
jgi:hypothetical protein